MKLSLRFLCVSTVLLGAFGVLIPILNGPFIYDDYALLTDNYWLQGVREFSDLFSFVHQPTKPLFNFSLAVGQLLGGGSIGVQRFLSFLLHIANVLLFWRFIKYYSARMSGVLVNLSALCLFFLAVNSEILYIVQFRGDLLLLFFTLVSLNLIVRQTKPSSMLVCVGIFFCVLCSALSKEVGLLVTPLVTLAFFVFGKGMNIRGIKREACFTVLGIIVSAIYIYFQLQRDINGWHFSYKNNIGSSVFSGSDHIVLAYRSLIEGVWKFFSGQELTTMRLSARVGPISNITPVLATLGFFCWTALLSLTFFRYRWTRFFIVAWLSASVPYLLIPNRNMGSEHYLYISAPWLIGFFVLSLQQPLLRVGIRRLVVLGVGSFVCLNAVTLIAQLRTLSDPVEYYRTQLEMYPKTSFAWTNYANALLRKNENQGAVATAGKLLDVAASRFGRDPILARTEIYYYYLKQDLSSMRRLTKEVEELGLESAPSEMTKFYYFLALMEAQYGYCVEASESIHKALLLSPGHPEVRSKAERLMQSISAPDRFCGLMG